MNYEDPNWNGASNNAAGMSATSQAGGGVLPTDTPYIAFVKAQMYEQSLQQNNWSSSSSSSSSNSYSGGSYGGSYGRSSSILEGITLNGFLITAVVGFLGFALAVCGYYYVPQAIDFYSSQSHNIRYIISNFSHNITPQQATALILSSNLDTNIHRLKSEVIENYLATDPKFERFRTQIASKLHGPNGTRNLNTLIVQYRKTAEGRNSAEYYALMYVCEKNQLQGCSLLSQGRYLYHMEPRTETKAALCSAQLGLRISALRLARYNDSFKDFETQMAACKKLGPSEETDRLEQRLKLANGLSYVVEWTPWFLKNAITTALVVNIYSINSAVSGLKTLTGATRGF